jgi:oligoendopeptidase F
MTLQTRQNPYEGPAWHNQSEYPSVDSNEFRHDRQELELLIGRLQKTTTASKLLMEKALAPKAPPLDPGERDGLIASLHAIAELEDQALTLVHNLMTYVHCELSIDAESDKATKIQSELQTLNARLVGSLKPSQLFLQRASEDLIARYLAHPHTQPREFSLKKQRELSDTLLSEGEEILLAGLRVHGLQGWSNLYNRISGHLQCTIEPGEAAAREVGLAEAMGLLRDPSEPNRRAAWQAIRKAWQDQETAGAAILNGLAGWRLEVCEKRSHTRAVHFLDQPLHASRITRETLEAMLSAVKSEIEVPRRALHAIARGLGKKQLDPWDLLAPAPPRDEPGAEGSFRPFKAGLHTIRDAFHSIDPSFGDFVDTMERNWWIEGRVLSTKAQGAYQTSFPKSRTPRVFQTYMGSLHDVTTLAHELGHAYHYWVMRDLPFAQQESPISVAETASIFAETVLSDHLLRVGNDSARFETAWNQASRAASFLINIPARFEFEQNFYERRKTAYVPADELSDLTAHAWQNWYGATLSQPERHYWLSKMHFSMDDMSFYNFPYTFGYLFSLGIYAQRAKWGDEFMSSYVALLRDTGRMTAEELVKKHLGEDITQPKFWKQSLAIVASQVEQFEIMLARGRN